MTVLICVVQCTVALLCMRAFRKKPLKIDDFNYMNKMQLMMLLQFDKTKCTVLAFRVESVNAKQSGRLPIWGPTKKTQTKVHFA